MARPLTVASVIEKNKIDSNVAFLTLIEIEVIDPNTGALVETLYMAHNDEPVNFASNGVDYHTYIPSNFSAEFTHEQGEEPRFTLGIQDMSGYVQDRLDAYAGGAGFNVHVMTVNAARLDQPPEMRETFQILSTANQNYVVQANLGAENLLNMRYPTSMQWRDRCRFRYKSPRCGYTGDLPTCSYTYEGSNGCKAHNNSRRFGGYPGIQILNL